MGGAPESRAEVGVAPVDILHPASLLLLPVGAGRCQRGTGSPRAAAVAVDRERPRVFQALPLPGTGPQVCRNRVRVLASHCKLSVT